MHIVHVLRALNTNILVTPYRIMDIRKDQLSILCWERECRIHVCGELAGHQSVHSVHVYNYMYVFDITNYLQ